MDFALSNQKNHIIRHIIPFYFSEVIDLSTNIHYGIKLTNEWMNILERNTAVKGEIQKSKQLGDFPKGENFEIIDYLTKIVHNDRLDIHNAAKNHTIGYQTSVSKKNTVIRLNFSEKDQSKFTNDISVHINNYDLIIFKTGIGFLSLELTYNGISTLNELIDLNNVIKNASRSMLPSEGNKSTCFYVQIKKTKRSADEVTQHDVIAYSDWIYDELNCFSNVTFFNGREKTIDGIKKSFPDKSIIFTSSQIQMPEDDKNMMVDFKKSLFRLSRGFDKKYDVKNFDYAENGKNFNENMVYSPFDYVHWAFSREGISNIVFEKHDTTFLGNDYFQRVKQNYLYLYIMLLHQYYGLILLNSKISNLPYNLDSYTNFSNKKIEESKENYKQLIALKDDIYFFYLKCIFEEVSLITHQNHYYKKIKQTLSIREIIEELDFELTKISELVIFIREEEQKTIEKKKKKRIDFITTGGGLLAVVTTYNTLEAKSLLVVGKIIELSTGNSKAILEELSDLTKLLITGITLCTGYFLIVLFRKVQKIVMQRYF